MITVVAKAFQGPEGAIPSGTIVDSTAWRNEARLLNCRFLRPATETEAAQYAAPTTSTRTARAAAPNTATTSHASKTKAKKVTR